MKFLKIENGEKLTHFGVKPELPSANLAPRIKAISSFMFVIVLQADWSKREIKDITNSRIVIDIANINDVIDIVITMGGMKFDVAYDVNQAASDIHFQEVEEGKGIAFHIILVSPDTTILYQRLFSLNTEPSNDFVNTLLDIKQKGYPKDVYMKKTMQLYNEMTVDEIQKKAFIHQNFFKKR